LDKNNLYGFLAKLILIGATAFSTGNVRGADEENVGAEKEVLDVNLSSIFVAVKPRANWNVQGDIALQYPVALTKNAEETGLGPIGAILYFDRKYLFNNEAQRSSVSGFGRMYYVYTAYEMAHTFVPYVTLYRDFSLVYKDAGNSSHESRNKAWLPPGLMYAYRKDDKTVLHFDAELYSYSQSANNIWRVGGSYALAGKWLLSASYERLGWRIKDTTNNNISTEGRSDSIYLKLINSNPFRNNFSLILGYAADKSTPGSGLLQPAKNRGNGLFGGVEFSLGTLAW
jgi:hypothetical protein